MFMILASMTMLFIGQVASGQIAGTVKDSAGQAAAGVTVAVTSTERNTSRTVVTDTDGLYKITSLTPGEYVLEVRQGDAARMRREGLRIVTGETTVVNVTLPARMTDTVTVT